MPIVRNPNMPPLILIRQTIGHALAFDHCDELHWMEHQDVGIQMVSGNVFQIKAFNVENESSIVEIYRDFCVSSEVEIQRSLVLHTTKFDS